LEIPVPALDSNLKLVFKIGDLDGDGKLDVNELHNLLELGDFCFEVDEVNALLVAADADKDGYVDFEEFAPMMIRVTRWMKEQQRVAGMTARAAQERTKKYPISAAYAMSHEDKPEPDQPDQLLSDQLLHRYVAGMQQQTDLILTEAGTVDSRLYREWGQCAKRSGWDLEFLPPGDDEEETPEAPAADQRGDDTESQSRAFQVKTEFPRCGSPVRQRTLEEGRSMSLITKPPPFSFSSPLSEALHREEPKRYRVESAWYRGRPEKPSPAQKPATGPLSAHREPPAEEVENRSHRLWTEYKTTRGAESRFLSPKLPTSTLAFMPSGGSPVWTSPLTGFAVGSTHLS